MIRVKKLDAPDCARLSSAIGVGLWIGAFASALVFIWLGNKWGHVPGLLHRLTTRSLPLLGAEVLLGLAFYAGWILKPGKDVSAP